MMRRHVGEAHNVVAISQPPAAGRRPAKLRWKRNATRRTSNQVVTRLPQCIHPRRTFKGAVGTLSRGASCGHFPRAQDRRLCIRCGSRIERGMRTDRLCVWADRKRGKVLCEKSAPA
eukprot:593962-Pleurochrysis_carterae.AAC.2